MRQYTSLWLLLAVESDMREAYQTVAEIAALPLTVWWRVLDEASVLQRKERNSH